MHRFSLLNLQNLFITHVKLHACTRVFPEHQDLLQNNNKELTVSGNNGTTKRYLHSDYFNIVRGG